MVDSKIIKQVKQRNNKAFKALYQNCIAYVYAIVRRYVCNTSDQPDVIQEIFARVFLSINTFDASKGDFKFWLRRLVINQCMQHHRQGKSPKNAMPLAVVREEDLGIEEELSTLSKEEIEELLSEMPEGYRRIFMLFVIDDYKHKEIAALLEISVETSRSQLSRAKNWIKKNMCLDKDGGATKSKTNIQKILINGL